MPPRPSAFGEDSNGQTVVLHVGQPVVVRLQTTDWAFGPTSDASVLDQGAPVTENGPAGCRTSSSCGSVAVNLTPRGLGRATVHASRERCGELRRCSAAQGSFTLTVDVEG